MAYIGGGLLGLLPPALPPPFPKFLFMALDERLYVVYRSMKIGEKGGQE